METASNLYRMLIVSLNDKKHPIQAFCEHVRLNLDQSQLFVLCCSICTLLKDQILSNAQRIAAYVILLSVSNFCSAVATTPFLELILNEVDIHNSPIERSFIVRALRSSIFLQQASQCNLVGLYQGLEDECRVSPAPTVTDIQSLRKECQRCSRLASGNNSNSSLEGMGEPASNFAASANTSIGNPDRLGPPLMGIGGPSASIGAMATRAVASIPISSSSSRNGASSVSGGDAEIPNIDIINRNFPATRHLAGAASTSASNIYPNSESWTEADLAQELAVLQSLAESEFSELKPSYVTWAPPPLEIDEDEVRWLHIDATACLLWNSSITENTDAEEFSHAKELLLLGVSTALHPKQLQEVMTCLEAYPSFVLDSELSPDKLPGLVENNWTLAAACIAQLIGGISSSTASSTTTATDSATSDGRSSSKHNKGAASSKSVHPSSASTSSVLDSSSSNERVMTYLSPLITMGMSFRSIEVVNELSNITDLPKEFIHLYISSCISSCENTQDKFIQSRLVRLVCVLLQSLIRKNVGNITNLFAELQAFCLTFTKVKEAVLLYRLIKSLEGH